MVKVAPEIYTSMSLSTPGETVLYVRLSHALYGIMKAALLYYQRFVADLKSIGFEINPTTCVANKIVKGKQLTVVFHVDDLKVSHVSPIVTKMADWLRSTYERLFDDGSGEMKICRGRFTSTSACPRLLPFLVVRSTMIPYVKEIVQQFAEFDDSDSTAATPAAEHLFKVNTKPPSPNDKRPYSTTSSPSVYFLRNEPGRYRYCVLLASRDLTKTIGKLTRMIRYLRDPLSFL
jgi:hypothetical protein